MITICENLPYLQSGEHFFGLVKVSSSQDLLSIETFSFNLLGKKESPV